MGKGENIVKWIKGQRISWLGHLERMEEDRMPQKDLHSRTGRDETKRKTQERMEIRSRKRSSSVGREKMERVGDRQGQMERYCSTGQSPQRAVAPTEEEEEYYFLLCATAPQWAMASSFTRFSRSHSDTPHSIGLVWTSDQLVEETAT